MKMNSQSYKTTFNTFRLNDGMRGFKMQITRQTEEKNFKTNYIRVFKHNTMTISKKCKSQLQKY